MRRRLRGENLHGHGEEEAWRGRGGGGGGGSVVYKRPCKLGCSTNLKEFKR